MHRFGMSGGKLIGRAPSRPGRTAAPLGGRVKTPWFSPSRDSTRIFDPAAEGHRRSRCLTSAVQDRDEGARAGSQEVTAAPSEPVKPSPRKGRCRWLPRKEGGKARHWPQRAMQQPFPRDARFGKNHSTQRDPMRKKLGQIAVVGLLVLAWAGSASAFEICLGIVGAGNKFKMEVTQRGNFMQLSGSERVFFDRSISGTAYVGSGGTFRLGFLWHRAFDMIGVDLSLSSTTLSGPFTTDGGGSGTMSVISCSGVLDADGLPDFAAQ